MSVYILYKLAECHLTLDFSKVDIDDFLEIIINIKGYESLHKNLYLEYDLYLRFNLIVETKKKLKGQNVAKFDSSKDAYIFFFS